LNIYKAKFYILRLVLFAALIVCTGLQAGDDYLTLAREIHQRHCILDSHVDIPWNFATEQVDPGISNDSLQVDLVKMRQGGLNCVFFIGFSSQGPLTPEGYEKARKEAMNGIEAVHRLCEQMYPEQIELAASPDEVARITSAGKLTAVIGMENGYPIGTDLSLVRSYYDLGVRYITLCHMGHNDICDSANPGHKPHPEGERLDPLGERLFGLLSYLETLYTPIPPEPKHNGLSRFGERVVAEMNRLGIIVDISHASEGTFWDVIKISKAPVIASHSSCRALCDITRNLDDRQLRALKENGGCIQVTTVPGFVRFPQAQHEAYQAMIEKVGLTGLDYTDILAMYKENQQAYKELLERCQTEFRSIAKQFPPADVADFVDHIDHVVKLVGIDHVGIGSDFGGGGGVVGFKDASEAVNVTAELLRRGYSEEEIAKIWGGNLLRVWYAVEKVSSTLRDKGEQ